MKKQILFTVLALLFVIGCQGQYPEHEVVDSLCVNDVRMKEDSVKIQVYYQSFDKGERYKINSYMPHPQKFDMIQEIPVHTYVCLDRPKKWRRQYVNDLMDVINELNSYKYGFYQIRAYEYGATEPEFTSHFSKGNPNYLGRN